MFKFSWEKVKTKRYDRILAKAFNVEGTLVELNLAGIESICFQHETDHCNGIVMHERQLGTNGMKSRSRNGLLRQQYI